MAADVWGMGADSWPDDAIFQRRRSETEKAYGAFMIYLSLDPVMRTVMNAHRQLYGEDAGDYTSWKRWASQHKWHERALEYERWKRQDEILAAEMAAAEEARRWASVRDEHRTTAFDLGKALLEKAKAMLQFPLAEVERVVTVYEDGKPREVQIFKPGKWTFGTIAQLVDAGDKLVRLAAEMDTQRSTVNLRLLRDEADELAKQHGLKTEDVLAMADKIVRERWPEHTPEE